MNGQQKVIYDMDAGNGPSKLWAIDQLIDDLITKADWSSPAPAAQKQQ